MIQFFMVIKIKKEKSPPFPAKEWAPYNSTY